MGYINREVRRFGTRCINTYEGIAITLRDEASFAQWVVVNIASIALTFFVEMTPAERMLIVALGLMILVVELLNTGIEAAIDRISEDIHPLSKKAKDCGCAAVAVMAIIGLIVWLMVFFT
jgi:diacylglycerol kinase (ATP)